MTRFKHIFIQIGIITINTFLPTINKFVYSCSIKIHASETLGKHFLPPAGCGSVFPEKSCRDAWRSGSALAEGQVNMEDAAKLCNPVHSTFEALILGLAVRLCHGELGPFCSNADCRYCSFWWSHWFAEHTFQCNGFAGNQKAVMDHTSSRPPNSDHDPLFGASLGLGSALELFLRPPSELVVSDCRIKSTFRCTSQSSREMVCCFCVYTKQEKMTLQNNDFFFHSAHEGPTYQAFTPFQSSSNTKVP